MKIKFLNEEKALGRKAGKAHSARRSILAHFKKAYTHICAHSQVLVVG